MKAGKSKLAELLLGRSRIPLSNGAEFSSSGVMYVIRHVPTRPRTAMNKEFYEAWKESECDWNSYCGGWMAYDGALCVERDYTGCPDQLSRANGSKLIL